MLWRRLLGNYDGGKVISAYRVALSCYAAVGDFVYTPEAFCPRAFFLGYFVLGEVKSASLGLVPRGSSKTEAG